MMNMYATTAWDAYITLMLQYIGRDASTEVNDSGVFPSLDMTRAGDDTAVGNISFMCSKS